MFPVADLDQLVCPTCRAPLAWDGTSAAGRIARGTLACAGCGARWPVADGLASLYIESEVRGNDRLLRHFYDGLPSLHDLAVRIAIPLAGSGTERAFRTAFLPHLDLGALRPRPNGRPVRILEIGIGTGANLALVRAALPPQLPVEIWGCDLSAGMTRVLLRRLARAQDRSLHLVLADAHALPFPDGAFDRVFHVGALNSYRDPRRALAEMARVARPGTPIVAVDEQLDPARRHSLYHRLMFRLVTFYDRHPHAPVEHLPPEATDVQVDQIARFLYSLRFRMPTPS